LVMTWYIYIKIFETKLKIYRVCSYLRLRLGFYWKIFSNINYNLEY
jgi:hypothetical protein